MPNEDEAPGPAASDELAELRLEVAALRARIGELGASAEMADRAIPLLFKLAIPSAAAVHKLLREMVSLVAASGQAPTEMEGLADRIRAALLALLEMTDVDEPDEGS